MFGFEMNYLLGDLLILLEVHFLASQSRLGYTEIVVWHFNYAHGADCVVAPFLI